MDDWSDAEADLGVCEPAHETEVRYALTDLGRSVLSDSRNFSGFGPCAAPRSQAEPREHQPGAASTRAGRARSRGNLPLFG
jgi:hypothetical protein